MNKKSVLLTALAIAGFAVTSLAQTVPNYVPTNGLVGWWPFNGNAIDESTNTNDGTVNGATLTSDRFGTANKAFSFINNSISFINSNFAAFGLNSFSSSVWAKFTNPGNNLGNFVRYGNGVNGAGWGIRYTGNSKINCLEYSVTNNNVTSGFAYNDNNWHNIIFVKDVNNLSILLYIDGVLTNTVSMASGYLNNISVGLPLNIGTANGYESFIGSLDDIGIWNRALSQQEITVLYNSVNCANNLTISPSNNQLQTGANANFNATTSDPSPSFVWQSDLGQGFQTLNNFGAYSGVNTSNLSIANVQLANHLQPIRVIATSGTCIDTSNVATINITDTCIVTINDTITTLISVTDTLIINSIITSLTPPNNTNTIKIWPNPTNDHITIDNGNLANLTGHQIKISNALGQQVFQSAITQQQFYVDMSTWGGNGIYFVNLINAQGVTIETRKIVLQ